MEDSICPFCGGEMEEFNQGIYECKDCENMMDSEIFDEME